MALREREAKCRKQFEDPPFFGVGSWKEWLRHASVVCLYQINTSFNAHEKRLNSGGG